MGPPRQRLTRIAGYRIGGDQSGGTGTILQPATRVVSIGRIAIDPRQPGLHGGMAARGVSTPPSTISAVPQ